MIPLALLCTVSYRVLPYLHFFLSSVALYLIDVESVRERCTESHEVSSYTWLRVCTWTDDAFKGLPQTTRFLRESGRERRKGKLYLVGCRKKSQTRQGISNPAKAQRGDGRVHARSLFMLRVVDFIVDQIPTAAQNQDQRDQRWSYCSWFVTTNFMSRQWDRPVVPPSPSLPPRH